MSKQRKLKYLIIDLLDQSDIPLKAKTIAKNIRDIYDYDCNRNDINRAIYGPLKYYVIKTSDYCWYTPQSKLIDSIAKVFSQTKYEGLLINQIIVKVNRNDVPRAYIHFIIELMIVKGLLKNIGNSKYILSKLYNDRKKGIENINSLSSDNIESDFQTTYNRQKIDEIVTKISKNKKRIVHYDLNEAKIKIQDLRDRAREVCNDIKYDPKWIKYASNKKLIQFLARWTQQNLKNEDSSSNKVHSPNSQDYWIFDSGDLDHDAIFTTKPMSNNVKIIFNENHPSYNHFKNLFLNDVNQDKKTLLNESDKLLKAIVLSWAKYEMDIPEGDLSEKAIDYRIDIGKYVKRMMRG